MECWRVGGAEYSLSKGKIKHDREWSPRGHCARPEISPESNSVQTAKVLQMKLEIEFPAYAR